MKFFTTLKGIATVNIHSAQSCCFWEDLDCQVLNQVYPDLQSFAKKTKDYYFAEGHNNKKREQPFHFATVSPSFPSATRVIPHS